MPKLKSLTTRTGVSFGLSMLLVLILILELAAGYLYWYKNLAAQQPLEKPDNVVRVDLPGYRKVIQYLDDLQAFAPDGRARELGNPFLYR